MPIPSGKDWTSLRKQVRNQNKTVLIKFITTIKINKYAKSQTPPFATTQCKEKDTL
jgi:hypothetical protein